MPSSSQTIFVPLRIAILTISDSRSVVNDISGDLLAARVLQAGHTVAGRALVRDEVSAIEQSLREWIDGKAADVILSTGGTGITGRDVTPEAFRKVIQTELAGFGELFRMLSYATIGTSAMLSRAIGGLSASTYLFALPGSPSAVAQAWDDILVHQLDSRTLPGNLVKLLPRLRER